MREIKFRCFDPSTNKVFIPDVVTGDGVPFASGRDYENGIDCSDCPLMQYTGLKDRNGKEIYEGDIVRFGFTDRHIVKYAESRRTSYGHGDCGESWLVGFDLGSSYSTGNQIEVIGNIYETPEQHG